MSTRSSRLYFHHGPLMLHVYSEFIDFLEHVEVEIGPLSLNVPYWRELRYYHRPRWFARWMCSIRKHDWFIEEMPNRTTQREDGRWNMAGRWSYKCQKCGVVRVDKDYGPPYAQSEGHSVKE